VSSTQSSNRSGEADVWASLLPIWIRGLEDASPRRNEVSTESGSDRVSCGAGESIKPRVLRFKNGNPKPPQQQTLIDELHTLNAMSLDQKLEILTAVRRIWNCEEVNGVVADLNLFSGDVRAERALKLAKWLFIEQDVTYWTESGRHMLRQWIESTFGALP